MKPNPADRRAAPRLKPAHGTTFRFEPVGTHTPGLVWNISRTGLSMLLGDAPKPDDLLAGELTLEGTKTLLPVMLQVVHVAPVPTGDHLIGARFLRELTDAELQPFLDPNTPPEFKAIK